MIVVYYRRLLITSLFFLPMLLNAQLNGLQLAKAHLLENPGKGDWLETDFAEAEITDQYTSKHNGVTHVYVQQKYQGVPVYNAIAGVHVRSTDSKVFFHTNRFFDHLSTRVVATSVKIPAERALYVVSNDLGISLTKKPEVMERSARALQFRAKELSNSPIPVQQVYFPTADGKLHLCWNLLIDDPRSDAGWNMFIDVSTGEVLNKKDETIYCSFEHQHTNACKEAPAEIVAPRSSEAEVVAGDGATYYVYPVPVESPNHGNRAYVIDPADPIASPFGWHDTNGREGPEYTYTRGNNVHAYRDADPDDAPDDDEPDGGEELFFDFPFKNLGNPTANSKASVTQIFYMNNYMHDFAYHFGFDEVSGNYQQNNYGEGGKSGDPVRAEAQDGSAVNNAAFFPSQDGQNGKMQMYLWTTANDKFRVNTPASLAGGYSYSSASFGPEILATISGNLVDGLGFPPDETTACSGLRNFAEVKGKIVLIDRGDCFFEEKAKFAETAGAIACVICNNQEGLVQVLGGLDTVPDPEISTVMITQADCAKFRAALQQGPVEVSIEASEFLDSGFDNGIIAHEYGHGISTRLTGGPATPFCLSNDEEMGEGWSDFFTLATLAQAEDRSEDAKGIGTYVFGQSPNGSGIRNRRYSTDMAVNEQTYDDVIGTTIPHDLGEIWGAVLWDIYWGLADKYGYDPDPANKAAGNNLAIQLIMDGMKFQACRPGFIDGRDGIIAADLVNNNGENECILWEIFSRRGLGWSAEQGESNNRNDNREAYDIRPSCIPTLKITKSSTSNIQPGEEFEVEITVSNDRATPVTEVIINDGIPTGAQFVPGTLKGAQLEALGEEMLVFNLGTIPAGESQVIRYRLASDPGLFSTPIFFDGAESGIPNWSPSDLRGSDVWRKNSTGPFAGNSAWFVPNTGRLNDQTLRLLRSITVEGELPVLRFYHRYDIQPGLDGGMVEISTNGVSWNPIPEELYFREAPMGRVAPSTFRLSRQKAFWGDSKEYVASYIDLSDYKGQRILFRFRYGSNDESGNNQEVTEGWYVDNIEVLEAENYATEVCLTTAQGDNICAMVEAKGTIVEANLSTNTEALLRPAMDLRIFPNPVSEQLNLSINTQKSERLNIRLTSLDGKTMAEQQLDSGQNAQTTQFDMSDFVPGIYLLHISGASDHIVEKIVVQ